MIPLSILSSGKALPSLCITSAELDVQLEKPSGYVEKRSGVVYRHHAASHEAQSDLAVFALKDALDRGGIAAGSIDLLLSASGVQEQALPSTACRILDHAGLNAGTPGFDIEGRCDDLLKLPGHDGSPVDVFADGVSRVIAQSLPFEADYRLIQDGATQLSLHVDAPSARIDACRERLVEHFGRHGVDGARLQWRVSRAMPPVDFTVKRRRIVRRNASGS